MKHLYFSPERDEFYGAYYPLRTPIPQGDNPHAR